MKLNIILIALCIGTLGFAQKKEKIKGNKFIKVKQHQIAEFSELNLNDKFECRDWPFGGHNQISHVQHSWE